MADEPRVPDFDLSNVNWDPVPLDIPGLGFSPPGSQEESVHTAPQPEKRKWWQSKKKDTEDKPKEKKRATPKREPKGGLGPALTQLYMGIGMFVMPIRPLVGKAILDNAEACSESLVNYANTNPAFKRFLINMVSTSDLGKVVIAHAPIMMAILFSIPGFNSFINDLTVKAESKTLHKDAENYANGLFPFSGFFPQPEKESDE